MEASSINVNTELGDDHNKDNKEEDGNNTRPSLCTNVVLATSGPNNKSSCLGRYAKFVNILHDIFTRKCLIPLILHVTRNPIIYIVIILFVSILLPTISVLTDSIQIKTRTDEVAVSQTSYPIRQMKWVEETFAKSSPITAGRETHILLHDNGENVLTYEAVAVAFEIANLIPISNKFKSVCVGEQQQIQGNNSCSFLLSVANFWPNHREFLNSVGNFTTDDERDEVVRMIISSSIMADGTPAPIESLLGRPQYKNTISARNVNSTTIEDKLNEVLISAQSIRTVLFIPSIQDKIESVYWPYEESIIQNVKKLEKEFQDKGLTYSLEIFNERGITIELEEPLYSSLPMVLVAFVIMAIYTAFAFSQWKPKNGDQFNSSHGLLGIGATFTVVLSIATGYGFCTLLGYPLTTITMVLPFCLIGIGIDDAFVLMGAFARTDDDDSLTLEQRIEQMTVEVGMSITITSVTDCLAFAFGALFTSMPAIRWFCFFATTCIAIDYFYQITFFIALLVLDYKRVKSYRRDFIFCLKVAPSQEPQGPTIDENSFITEQPMDAVQRISTVYSNFLLRPATKFTVLMVFTALAGLGIYFATKVEMEFDLTKLTSEGSYIDDFLDADQTYFSNDGALLQAGGIYFHNLNVSDPYVQQSMLDFVDDLQIRIPYINESPSHFWLRDFHMFLNVSSETIRSYPFETQLSIFMETDVAKNLYIDSVLRDTTTGAFLASRTLIGLDVEYNNARTQVDLLRSQRRITLEQPLNKAGKTSNIVPMFLYHPEFPIFEHYRRLSSELVFSLLTGLVAVGLVAAIFFPHPSGTLLCIISVAAVDIELVGLISVMNFNLNSITVILLIMAIGLVVDYCIHMVHAFFTCPDAIKSSEERVKYALVNIGTSVFAGAFSTFLGAAALAFASTEIFWIFFVMFEAMVVLGLAHGLIFIPVALSFL